MRSSTNFWLILSIYCIDILQSNLIVMRIYIYLDTICCVCIVFTSFLLWLKLLLVWYGFSSPVDTKLIKWPLTWPETMILLIFAWLDVPSMKDKQTPVVLCVLMGVLLHCKNNRAHFEKCASTKGLHCMPITVFEYELITILSQSLNLRLF